jgi:hypothetical protein
VQVPSSLKRALVSAAFVLVCGTDAGAEDEVPCAGECGQDGPGCTTALGDSYSTETVTIGQTQADNPGQPGRLYRKTCKVTYTAVSTVCVDADGNIILHTAGTRITGPTCTIQYL